MNKKKCSIFSPTLPNMKDHSFSKQKKRIEQNGGYELELTHASNEIKVHWLYYPTVCSVSASHKSLESDRNKCTRWIYTQAYSLIRGKPSSSNVCWWGRIKSVYKWLWWRNKTGKGGIRKGAETHSHCRCLYAGVGVQSGIFRAYLMTHLSCYMSYDKNSLFLLT